MILSIIFFTAALILALLGTVYLILYRMLESSDKIAITKAVFIKTKTIVYRGHKRHYPIYEYAVGNKKYRKRVEPLPSKPHRNSEAVYLKSFPRIAYIKYSGNDFGMASFGCFACAITGIVFSLVSYFIFSP